MPYIFNPITKQLDYYATIEDGSGFALVEHTHTESDINDLGSYAAANHTHAAYALSEHTHDGYADAAHTHDDLVPYTGASESVILGSDEYTDPSELQDLMANKVEVSIFNQQAVGAYKTQECLKYILGGVDFLNIADDDARQITIPYNSAGIGVIRAVAYSEYPNSNFSYAYEWRFSWQLGADITLNLDQGAINMEEGAVNYIGHGLKDCDLIYWTNVENSEGGFPTGLYYVNLVDENYFMLTDATIYTRAEAMSGNYTATMLESVAGDTYTVWTVLSLASVQETVLHEDTNITKYLVDSNLGETQDTRNVISPYIGAGRAVTHCSGTAELLVIYKPMEVPN